MNDTVHNLKPLYDTLIEKGTPTLEGAIYIMDGLYMLPNGELVDV